MMRQGRIAGNMSHPKFNLWVTHTIKTPTPVPLPANAPNDQGNRQAGSPAYGGGEICEIGCRAGKERPHDIQFRVFTPLPKKKIQVYAHIR